MTSVRATPGVSLWAVGGLVRDCALSRAGATSPPVRDLDLATDGDVEALARAIATRLESIAPGRVSVHLEPRFATATVSYRRSRLDLAALRAERYVRPGALPTVRRLAPLPGEGPVQPARSGAAPLPGESPVDASIEADLARRDFSVNAIALGLAGPARGRLVDPFGGLDDLAARRLRVLHDGSFLDDATRLWRAARFAARLRLQLDPTTAQLVAEALRGRALDPIAARRLWREWTLLAAEPRVGTACLLLDAWGALPATHAALRLAPSAASALARLRGPLIPVRGDVFDRLDAPDVLFALMAAPLRPAARAAVAARLGASRTAIRAAEACVQLLAARASTPAALARLEGTPLTARIAAARLDPVRQPALQRALARWERTRSPLDARALIALGVAPGPALGATLARLRRARYLGTLVDAAAARASLRRSRAVAAPRGARAASSRVGVEKRNAS